MAEQIRVVLSGDAQQLIASLKQAGLSVDQFSQKGEKAKKSTFDFSGELTNLAGEVGLTLGLGALVSGLGAFVKSSVEAADAARVAGTAFTNLSGGSATAAKNMDAVARATSVAGRQVVSETERMQIANQLMGMGIANNAAELEKTIHISRRLGAAFRGLGAAEAAEEFAVMMANMSVERLDSFGISSGRVRERIKQLMDETAGMSREQAFFTATMEEAEKTMARLGPEVETTGQALDAAKAATADFSAAFGQAITDVGSGSGIFDLATAALGRLQRGAEAWSYVFAEALPAIEAHNNELDQARGNALATANSYETLSEALKGGVNDFEEIDKGLALATGSFEEYQAALKRLGDVNANEAAGQFSGLLGMIGMTEEEYNRLKEETEAAAEASEELAAAQSGVSDALASTGAAAAGTAEQIAGVRGALSGFFNEFADLGQGLKDFEAESINAVADAIVDSQDRIAELERDRQEAIGEAQAAGNADRIGKINAHYDELIAETQAREDERIAKIKEKLDEEKALYEQRVQDLKVQTALGILEASGELEQLTGVAGAGAQEVNDLLQAGILPLTDELAARMQAVLTDINAKQADVTAAAEQNAARLAEVASGAFAATGGGDGERITPGTPGLMGGPAVNVELSTTNAILDSILGAVSMPQPIVNQVSVAVDGQQIAGVITPQISRQIGEQVARNQRIGGAVR